MRRAFVRQASSMCSRGSCGKRGATTAIRCDQGTGFTAEALDQSAYTNKIKLDFLRPGKPTDDAFIESFNAVVACRRDYNGDRPHRSLSNKTTASLCGISERGAEPPETTLSGELANGAPPPPCLGSSQQRPCWTAIERHTSLFK